MKINKLTLISFAMLVVVASLYRVMPDRAWGFAPHIAMALFAGSVIKNRALAFMLPVASLLISDIIYEVLFSLGLSPMSGFYNGQILNYLFLALIAVVGFFVNRKNILSIGIASLVGPTVFFLLSNFGVWLTRDGFVRPFTFEGLMMTYADGLPFYKNSIAGTLFFSAILFGGYYLIARRAAVAKKA